SLFHRGSSVESEAASRRDDTGVRRPHRPRNGAFEDPDENAAVHLGEQGRNGLTDHRPQVHDAVVLEGVSPVERWLEGLQVLALEGAEDSMLRRVQRVVTADAA